MIPGAPEEARWVRRAPRRVVSAPTLARLVQTTFPHARVTGVRPFADGLRNANFLVRLDSMPVVLRIYEHDPSLCQKEVDLIRLAGGSVPVPEVIHAEPLGFEDFPPFAWMGYVEGISFRALRRAGDREAIAQAARSAGEALAAIGRIGFARAGWLAPGPVVTEPLLEGANSMPRFVDRCLSSPNLQRRTTGEWRERVLEFVWSRVAVLADLEEEARLVHGDFNRRNLLVRCVDGKWRVSAVLDWEFAISSTPLCDFGTFLRYERASRPLVEPHFSTAYVQAGGRLPSDWRRLARVVDLIAVCESLTHEELPEGVVSELVELVAATVEDREPRLA